MEVAEDGSSSSNIQDWAFIILQESSLEPYGFIPISNVSYPPERFMNESVMLTAYSGDIPQGDLEVDGSCTIKDVVKQIYHDCDSNPGASEASLLKYEDSKDYEILALH